jgi:hypothetical protein
VGWVLECSRVMGGGVPEPCGVSHEGLQSAKCLDCLEECGGDRAIG